MFYMVPLRDSTYSPTKFVGPLLDDSALYRGLGLNEFELIQLLVLLDWNGSLDVLP